MEAHLMPDSECPACGYSVDCASNMTSGDVPAVGDYTICLDCGALNCFDIDMTLKAVADPEAVLADTRFPENAKRAIALIRTRGRLPLKH